MKKITSIFLAILLLVSLAGCSNQTYFEFTLYVEITDVSGLSYVSQEICATEEHVTFSLEDGYFDVSLALVLTPIDDEGSAITIYLNTAEPTVTYTLEEDTWYSIAVSMQDLYEGYITICVDGVETRIE